MKSALKPLIGLLILFSAVQLYAQEKQPIRIKVGTYNVGHFNQGNTGGFQGRHFRAEAQKWRAWVGSQSLDVLVVNEWNKGFDKDSTLNAEEEILKPYYNHRYFGQAHTWIFNGIASHYKLKNIRQKNWFGEYYALVGDLVIDGTTVTVLSTHMPWQQQWHRESLELLIKELRNYEYFICMGDINALDEEQLRFMSEGFNIANGGYQGWFLTAPSGKLNGKKDGLNIDNIITSKNIKIMNISAPYTGLNDQDHLPVIADIIITR